MSRKPLRLSELKLTADETPARQSRGSKIPFALLPGNPASRKRSLSAEPKSATKIRTTMTRVPVENSLARSRTMASICQTPLVTPTRSTIGSTSKTRTPGSQNLFRKDPVRPTMDKIWQYNESNALCHYLVDNSLHECITKGNNLKSMSVKQFVSTIIHFSELIQNKFKITIANYVDEVPKMMKAFDYNGQLTRSILIAPNTMHSWPHALALLSGLRVMCESQQGSIPFSREQESNTQMNTITDSVFKMYHLWNEENEEDLKSVQDDCINKLYTVDDCEEYVHIVEKKKVNATKLEASVNNAKMQYEEIEKEIKALEEKKINRDKLEEKRQSISDEVEACKQKFEDAVHSKAELRATYERLESQVKTQKISVEQKANIDKEMSNLKRQIDNDKKMCNKLTETNFELNLKFKQRYKIMDNVICEYNCLTYKLAESLSTLKLDFNVDDLRLDELSIDICLIKLTQKLEEELKSTNVSREEFLKNIRDFNALKEKMHKEIQEAELLCKRFEDDINKVQENHKYMNEQYDARISEFQQQIKESEEEINSSSKYEEMKMHVIDRINQSKMKFDKQLETFKSIAAQQEELFEKMLKTDRDRLVSLHESIVKANNEFGPFLEILERFRVDKE